MKYCPNCGVQADKTNKFCVNCGSSLTAEEEEPKLKKSEKSVTKPIQEKIENKLDVKLFFPSLKNLFWGEDIPWKRFKDFIRQFENEEIKDFEFLNFYDNSKFGSPSETGFSIAKNGDEIYLLLSSYETKRVAVKVVAWYNVQLYKLDEISTIDINSETFNIRFVNGITGEIAENSHSKFQTNAQECLINFIKNSKHIDLSNQKGLTVNPQTLTENSKANFKEKITAVLLILALLAILYRGFIELIS
jgi:hypothetical protein